MRRGALAVLLALALSSGSRAYAQAAQDKAAAEVLFEEGKELMRVKKYAAACPKFLESNRLDAGVGTSLWLADCYEKNGQSASAWGQFREAAEVAARSRDPREKVARDRAGRLEPTLVKMAILVPPAAVVPGLVVQRDGANVGQPLWGEEVPVDPGPHKITATAPHKKPWEGTVNVYVGGKNVDASVPVLEDLPEPPPTAIVEGDPSTGPSQSDSSSSGSKGDVQRAIGGVVIGLGVVGVGLGAYFGIQALTKNNDSNANGGGCDFGGVADMCNANGTALRNSALSAAKGSTIAFVAGGVLTAAGIVVVLSAPHSRNRENVSLVPLVQRDGAGVGLSGAW